MEDTGIYNYLDCSTTHITPEDDQWLESIVIENEPLIVYSTGYGFWILVESAWDTVLIPAAVSAILQKALNAGCTWIKLDNCGVTHDDLPQYKW